MVNRPNPTSWPVRLLYSPGAVVYLLWVVLLLAVPTAQAQTYHLESIEETNGLPSPVIKDIDQDRLGLIWVGTRGGLTRFDGTAWLTQDLDSLVHDSSDAMLELDGDGEVWALFSGFQPTLLRRQRCHWYPIPLPDALEGDRQTFRQFALSQDGGEVVPLILAESPTLHMRTEGQWREVDLEAHEITDLTSLQAIDGVFYLASPEGLYSLTPRGPLHPEPVPLPADLGPVLCLSPGLQAKEIWLVGPDWIGRQIDGRTEVLYRHPGGHFDAFVEAARYCCLPDAYGGLYLAGGVSTQYYHPDTGLQDLGRGNGLVDDTVRTLFRDREQVIWLGTERGITKVISRQTAGFSRAQGLLEDEVTALLQKLDGTIVIGHPTGLTLWNGEMKTIPFTDTDLRDRVLDLAEDSRGNVWIAGRHRGLGRLSPDGKLKWWHPGPDYPSYFVSVSVDLQDVVWVVASDRVLVLEDEELRVHTQPDRWGEDIYLRRIVLEASRTAYLASGSQGVLVFRDGDLEQWSTGYPGHGNSVFDILEGSDERIYAGTRAGLYLLEGGRLTRPLEPHLKIEDPVYFVESDYRGRLWVGTDNGVLRIDGESVHHFTAENGLLGRETNRCASLIDSFNRLWVGTERGLTIIDGRFEGPPPLSPQVALAKVEAGGFERLLFLDEDQIELPRSVDNLVFHFRAITTTEPRRLEVRARLEGVDEAWITYPNPGGRLRYSNIGPGTYRLHLSAAGHGQPWSPEQVSPLVIVPAPIWQRGWFLMVAVLIGLALLILPIILLVQRRYNRMLKQEVAVQVEAKQRAQAELEHSRRQDPKG